MPFPTSSVVNSRRLVVVVVPSAVRTVTVASMTRMATSAPSALPGCRTRRALSPQVAGRDRVLRAEGRFAGRTAYCEHTDDAQQELFGLLVVYQAARHIVVDAALQAGIAPSRISLAVTIRTARNTVSNFNLATDRVTERRG